MVPLAPADVPAFRALRGSWHQPVLMLCSAPDPKILNPCVQVGVAVGSLALVVVFLFSSGGSDLVQSTQQSRPAPTAGEHSP